MIADLKPYAEYKESGVPWLGQVPGHWALLRSKRLFSARKDLAFPEDVQLSATQSYGVIPQSDFEEKVGRRVVKISMHLEKRRHVEKNDFVISMRSFQGGIERAWASGAIRSSYVVLKPESGVNVGFFSYLFKSHSYIRALQATADFIRDGQDLNFSNFCGVDLPTVPLAEQAAIVRFLDWANGRLERAVRAKRKVIALLNEQKQAIIHRAVTRGLDPSVPLKPSGIPWLGDIPARWGIVRNMALFAHRVEAGIAGLPVLQVSLRSGITAEELDQFGRPKKLIADPTKYKRIYRGDIAYNTMRMWQGAVGVSPSHGLVSPAYVVLNPRVNTCPDYYDFIFHTDVYKQQVNRQSTGIVPDRNRLYWDSFKQMPNISLPRSEQEQVVAFILSETSSLNAAIARLEREIELLREYRTRLVADVVTGKLDVREAAARLPEEIASDAAEVDIDPSVNPEAADEEAAV